MKAEKECEGVSRIMDEDSNKTVGKKQHQQQQQPESCASVVKPPSPRLLLFLLSSSPFLLTDEAATAPSHPSVLSLINQTIRLQLQLWRRRR